jgi:AGZA family xanthine/uracil permease-like MFS transporter
LLIGILAVTVASFFFGGNTFHGIFSAPPSIEPTFMKLDIKTALTTGFLNVVLVFFLVELFDATGTLMGVARRAGLLVPERMGRFNRSLLADSGAILWAPSWVPPAPPPMWRALPVCRPAAVPV